MPDVIYFDYVHVKVRDVKVNISNPESRSKGRPPAVLSSASLIQVCCVWAAGPQQGLQDGDEGVGWDRSVGYKQGSICTGLKNRENKGIPALPGSIGSASHSCACSSQPPPFPPLLFSTKLLCSKDFYSLKIC